MSRRIAIRFMLSLLLLLSQQMAVSHAMSHFAGAAHGQRSAEEDGRLSKAVAQDQSCDQCLSFAQIAGAIGAEPNRFLPPDGSRLHLDGAFDAVHGQRQLAAFDARAPPAFA